jgi:formate hydrogenlyase subunit 3/multisubunit Na+/H+ antiporter MnhD subunit
VFWGAAPPDGAASADGSATPVLPGARSIAPMMWVSTVVVVLFTVGLMVFAGPLYDFSERAAADLLDPAYYVSAVVRGRS